MRTTRWPAAHASPLFPGPDSRANAGADAAAPKGRWRHGLGLCLAIAMLMGDAVTAGERGKPLVEVYDSEELGGGHANESVIELPDGRIAVANIGGVLLFDGARWRMFKHPLLLGGMRRLALTPDGRLYTGFDGDLGYYAEDGTGALVWQSLKDRVAEADREFGTVTRTYYDADRDGIWFLASKRLFFLPLAGGPIQSHAATGFYPFAGPVGADFWVQDSIAGLQRVRALSPLQLEPLPQREPLGTKGNLRAVIADDGEWKLALDDGRLYSYRNGAFHPWAEAQWPLFASSNVFSLVRLRDGRYAIGSAERGPVFLDAQGRVLEQYDRSDGVPANATRGLFEDSFGGLWLAQIKTVTRVDLARGITQYDEDRGLSFANTLARWRGQIYVASLFGLYRLQAAPGPGGGNFERMLPDLHSVQYLAVIDDGTLLVDDNAIYAVSSDPAGKLESRVALAVPRALALKASRFVPGRAWVAHAEGVTRLDRAGSGDFVATPVAGLTELISFIEEEDADTLWAATRSGGIFRVSVSGAAPPLRLTENEGVPAGTVRLFPKAGAGVFFAGNTGVMDYDAATGRLVPAAGLPRDRLDALAFRVFEDQDRNIWVRGETPTGEEFTDVAWRSPDGFRWDRQLFSAASSKPTVYGFVREQDIVWVLRADGLLRIDLAARRELPPPRAPIFTRADDLGVRQPLVLAGLSGLPAAVRNVRLGFALPAPFRPELTLYRSRLVGIDPDWSDWTEAATRDYTSLPDGEFLFEVEARDVFARTTSLAPVTLSVAPPWWRTGWAYAAYLAMALLALWWASWLGARRRQHSMLARQRELEATVAERTAELARSLDEVGEKNVQLAEQAERLMEVDRLKTRFFVNVGHEFRTPLTLVLGPIEDLLRDGSARLSERVREQLELAHRNARRVLSLIVEILDVNRLEHGHLPFRRERLALNVLLRRALDAAQPLVERHGHTLVLAEEQGAPLEVDADPGQLERCISNLVGNAAKFMPRGGRIEVTLARDDDTALLGVRDYGRGIAAAALPHVFDRFFQTEGGDEASGYGVGLALVREIVEGHEGRISVQSELGVGSTFTIALPLAAAPQIALPAAGETPSTTTAVVPETTAAEEPAAAAGAMRERPLVLVVDDHDDLRLRLRHLFEARFEVAEAADGPAAWRAATELLPDVIVCDVMMPGFDGVELTRRLRAHADTAAIALLLLTAKAGSEHAVVGLNAGANDYLEKPFDSSELLARVEGMLAQAQRLRHQLARRSRPVPEAPRAPETADERWRRRLDAALDAGLDDSGFGVDELAQAIHGDRSTLFRKCKQLVGMNPSEYLRERRLARGRELLLQGAGSVSEVAYAVGFESLASFTRAFKTRYGEPPSALRGTARAEGR